MSCPFCGNGQSNTISWPRSKYHLANDIPFIPCKRAGFFFSFFKLLATLMLPNVSLIPNMAPMSARVSAIGFSGAICISSKVFLHLKKIAVLDCPPPHWRRKCFRRLQDASHLCLQEVHVRK